MKLVKRYDGMYQKYRVFVKTSRGSWFAASSDVLNGLAPMVADWLDNTSAGRSIYEYEERAKPTKPGQLGRIIAIHSDVRSVALYELKNKGVNGGDYARSEELPATDKRDLIRKVRQLGGR